MQRLKEEAGFTLIEMMIVLLIISVLILIAIPNVTKHSKSIDEKGCEAYIKMAQGQVEAFKMDKQKYPATMSELVTDEYLPEDPKCPDGRDLTIADGKVKLDGP